MVNYSGICMFITNVYLIETILKLIYLNNYKNNNSNYKLILYILFNICLTQKAFIFHHPVYCKIDISNPQTIGYESSGLTYNSNVW